jgi:thiol:disulfide interchange protein DsbD
MAQSALAQSAAPKVQADLIAAVDAVEPGVPFTIGLRQRITPHWHTYWKNPGDSGEPTRITWSLPEGFSASQLRWPAPHAIPVGPLVNFGYSGDLLLPVTITPPKDLAADSVHLRAHATWLVCEKICVPEEADLELTLPVARAGSKAGPSVHADLFARTERAIPKRVPWAASFTNGSDRIVLDVAVPKMQRGDVASAAYFPNDWGGVDYAGPQDASWDDGGLKLAMKPGETAASAKSLDGVLVLTDARGGRHAFEITARLAASQEGALASATNSTTTQASRTDSNRNAADAHGGTISVWQAMLLALIGGLILNLMPCVLPILSLKAVTLAKHGGSDGGEAARSGVAYFAGVIVSFTALALVLASLRSAGLAFGWGFQFQSPVFVLAMAALFLTLALSLSGVFEIGTRAAGVGEGLTQKDGVAGSFFTGVLATIAATPCTAPFMGVAVGFALTQPPLALTVVMLSMGLGFGLPVLALSLSPAVRGWLPRPGAWMQTFKQVLAFPLYATVAWLVWVLSLQTGSDGVLVAGITLTAVGFAAWLFGTGASRLRGAVAVAVVAAAFALTLPWLGSTDAPRANSHEAAAGAEPYSAERVAELRAAGRPVFVNLTAAWCITCKVNERVALSSNSFRKALSDHNIAYLKGDWTRQDERITRILKSFGRAGVPLYLLYPADAQKDAIVLPQLLTEAIVVRHFAELDRKHAAKLTGGH